MSKKFKTAQIPPHANAESHSLVMTWLNSASPADIARTAEKAGIYTSDGQLAPEYRAPKK